MSIPINIENLISGTVIEGTRVEFKEGWNPKTVMRTVCAFANDFENEGSGYIVIGVHEVNGKAQRPVMGFNTNRFEQIQKELIGYCNLIQPSYVPRISLEELDEKQVLVIWVPAGSNRPYIVPDDVKAKNKNFNFRIRQFSSSVIPNQEQEAELIQLTARIPFDDRLNTQASVGDLSFPLMREHLYRTKSKLYSESASMSVEELAQAMNLCEGAKEHLFPKNIGLLMFSEDPRKYFPYIQIDVVDFPEGVGAKKFNEKIFTGAIQKQLIDALSYINTNFIKEKIIKYSDRAEADRVYNYPYEAIEEALANAVYHRSYDLREPIEVRILPQAIEIISHNGIDPSLKQSDFEKGLVRIRRYRNRRIGGILKELELTEGRGTGIPTIYRALKNNGSPKPVFDINEPNRSYFLIEIPINQEFIKENDQVADQVADQVQTGIRFAISYKELLEQLSSNTKVNITPEKLEKYKGLAENISAEQHKVLKYTQQAQKRRDILEQCLKLSNHTTNFKKHIEPLILNKLLQYTVPDRPNSQFQKYLLTVKGKVVLYILNKSED